MLHGYGNRALSDGEGEEDELEDFEDDFHVLRGYSLINLTAITGVCCMHSLVRFCTQVALLTSDPSTDSMSSLDTPARAPLLDPVIQEDEATNLKGKVKQ
jgi:hypothetical protein